MARDSAGQWHFQFPISWIDSKPAVFTPSLDAGASNSSSVNVLTTLTEETVTQTSSSSNHSRFFMEFAGGHSLKE